MTVTKDNCTETRVLVEKNEKEDLGRPLGDLA